MIALGDLPVRYIVRKIALVLPFAFLVGMFNPVFDREVLVRLGPLGISGGWISCASIIVRAILTVGAALILVAVTGFPAICRALERLGMPRVVRRAAPVSLPLHLRAHRGRGAGVAGAGAPLVRQEGAGDAGLRLPGRPPPAPDLAPGGAHPHGHAGAGLHRRIPYAPAIPVRRQGTPLSRRLVSALHHPAHARMFRQLLGSLATGMFR